MVTARTDTEGRFRLGPLPVKPMHVIWCEAPGHARLRLGEDQVPGLAVFPEATHDLGDIVLERETAVIGKVVDAHGRPIAGARVVVTPRMHQLAHTVASNGPPHETESLADGTFRVGSLGPGHASVEVAVAGRPRERKHAWLAIGTYEVDCGMIAFRDERCRLRGRVTDGDGNGIEGVRVHANDDREAFALTGADGWFDLEVRAAEVAWASVSKEGWLGYQRRVENLDDMHFAMERARFLDGWVLDAETGEPVAVEDVSICEVRRREADGALEYAG
jgi:hypothetical protein